jgi:hypothetical protein
MDFLKYPYLSEKTVHIFVSKGFPYTKNLSDQMIERGVSFLGTYFLAIPLKNLDSLLFDFSIVGQYLYLMTISHLVLQAVHLPFQEVP